MKALRLILIAMVVLVLASCGGDSEIENGETKQPEEADRAQQLEATQISLEATQSAIEIQKSLLSQWAISAVASSEYGNPEWAAIQAVGAPDTLECGDIDTAWASLDGSGIDWLELYYEMAVIPTQIMIRQTHTPDQIVRVEVIDLDGNYHTVHTNTPRLVECPYENTIAVSLDFPVNGVRIQVDQSVLEPPWDEIDAVELVGYPATEAAAASATQPPSDAEGEEPEEVSGAEFVYTPNQIASGSFIYEIVGDGRDAVIEGTALQDQSTTSEYVIGLNSDDLNYSVTLFLPFEIPTGLLELPPYDPSAFTKGPNLAIFVRTGFYYPISGFLLIEDHGDGTISGSFTFIAEHQDDSSRTITVHGAFNHIQLP